MTKFEDFLKEVEEEAKADGPDAVAALKLLKEHFTFELNDLRDYIRLRRYSLDTLNKVDDEDI